MSFDKHESCAVQVAHWLGGVCYNGGCVVTECETDYKPGLYGKVCAPDCDLGKHYDNETQSCIDDTIENCGSNYYKCSDQVANWNDGLCANGICIVSECVDGFKPAKDGKSCISNCSENQHFDALVLRCVDDDINNCGQVGYNCSEHISNWETGECLAGVCIVSECADGFKPASDAKSCASDCSIGQPGEVGQHYDSMQQKCVDDDLDNCGQKGYVCSSTSGWKGGKCLNNTCVAEECDSTNGYTVVEGKCVAACIGNQVKCGGLCRDPMQDSEYCGAKGTINSCTNEGKKCAKGQVCVNGNCEQNTCASIEILCSTESGKSCVNVKAADATNCGSCGFVCKDHAIPNATSSLCAAGACQYECTTGYVNVGNGKTSDSIVCINPKTDSNYCGATSSTARGQKCETGKVCVDGSCATNSCTNKSETLCSTTSGNTCINLKASDANNCGACGYKCSEHAIQNATSTVCNAGNCEYTCATGYVNVGSGKTSATIKCVDPKTDNQFCGASATSKGNACLTGTVCVDGSCATNSCTNKLETLCSTVSGNKCININSVDANNCGACGYKCSEHAIQNATSNSCNAGSCEYTCATGYVNVGSGKTSATIKCVDPKTDNQFCGATSAAAKGQVCSTGKVCIDGNCAQNSCDKNSAETLCSTTSGNTCINLKSTDTNNCGACGYKCSEHAIQNATSNSCNSGNCQYTCATGYVNVGTGRTAATIKCVDPKTDNQFCGATSASSKGQVCSTGKVCVDGSCAQNSCDKNSGETLCSTTLGNTCINLKSTDANNCGACGYKCSEHAIQNATSTTCSAGNCQYVCATGYVNVGTGNSSATIKCIDPKTDNQFCGATDSGAKGSVCTTGTVCINGKCATNECTDKNETLCSTTSGNTCMNIKSSDANNCGACGYRCSDHAIQNATSNTCNTGNCEYTCSAGYVNVGNGKTSAMIKCVDPKTDNQFCGATSATSRGFACTTGQVCINGNCEQNSCTKSSETLCSTTLGNKCINIKSSDADNCGACGYKCSDHAIQNATSNTCSSGNCSYTCSTGYVNVGSGMTMSTIRCIDPKTDNSFCGATDKTKGESCGTGKFCIDGKCTSIGGNSCGLNEHVYKTGCEADSESNCGMHGNSCSMKTAWGTGICSGGECISFTCVGNFHPEKGNCVEDSADACGVDKAGLPYSCKEHMPSNGLLKYKCENKECFSDGPCATGYVGLKCEMCDANNGYFATSRDAEGNLVSCIKY